MGPLEELLDKLNQLVKQNTSYSNFTTITPSDTDEIDQRINAVIIGATGGDLVIEGDNEEEVTIPVSAEDIVPVNPKLVKATGTTATPLIGAW